MKPIQKIFFGVFSFVGVLVLIWLWAHLFTDSSQWARTNACLDSDVKILLELARTNGYRRVRLMVATPDLQTEAIGLYTRLGFRPLPANENNTKELHMVLAFS
jgi:GNAT superfamily N-acetyltransferase